MHTHRINRKYALLMMLFITGCIALYAQPVQQKEDEQFRWANPEVVFKQPPETAKPGVLWMWMGTNLSMQGITKDLEALKKAGFNRTTMFSLSDITTPWACDINNSPTPGIISWTPAWWKFVRHAAKESKRLGMDFGMFNGPSYESSGGKWITPELSMQELCWSQQLIEGNRRIKVLLEKPNVNPKGNTPFPIYNGETGKVEIPEVAARKTYYKDIAVVAVPADGDASAAMVKNLTSNMNADGQVQWEAPPGKWILYRFGHTTSGTYIQPAQWQATGLECDKMSVEAVSFHIDHIIGEIKKNIGDLIGTGFTHVHFDSYEAGYPTWTPRMQQQFLNRRGYDPTIYLPNFAGHRIGSKTDSIQFRKDFDATVKDLYRDVYFKTLADKLKAANLEFLCEPYGGPWRQDEILPMIGKVMTEFWTNNGNFTPYELKPTVDALRNSGQNIVEAEAFTGLPGDSKWAETPAWLKPIGDAAFCEGVNRLILHRFVHQPFEDRFKPGATMGRWGTHFDRTQTWWEPGKAMIAYWQKCQALLQWGNIVLPHKDDFVVTDTSVKKIRYIHRNYKTTDIYFVANTGREKVKTTCRFMVNGMQPELWDAVTGNIRPLYDYTVDGNNTMIPLEFDAAQSFFIVFRTKAVQAKNKTNNFPASKEVIEMKGAWSVKFDPAWGGEEKPLIFETLTDWTLHTNPGIKYYSGTAVYKKTFALPADIGTKGNFSIDLGTVHHIANVKLNGKLLGVVWTAPWKIDIPAGLLQQQNVLEIEVTNVWANRLIGDEQQPADSEWEKAHVSGGYYLKSFPDWFVQKKPRPSAGRYCFTTWNYFTPDSPLIPSGLIGPVRITKE